jgi:chromosome segregation ATPase
MTKSALLTTFLSIVLAIFSLNALADDASSQISSLQQRAERIQDRIKQSQQQCDTSLDSQIKPLMASVESLVKQRMELGAYIVKLEAQIDELQKGAKASCGNQVKHYEQELAQVKQQIAGMTAKKNAEAAQKAQDAGKEAPAQAGPSPASGK